MSTEQDHPSYTKAPSDEFKLFSKQTCMAPRSAPPERMKMCKNRIRETKVAARLTTEVMPPTEQSC